MDDEDDDEIAMRDGINKLFMVKVLETEHLKKRI